MPVAFRRRIWGLSYQRKSLFSLGCFFQKRKKKADKSLTERSEKESITHKFDVRWNYLNIIFSSLSTRKFQVALESTNHSNSKLIEREDPMPRQPKSGLLPNLAYIKLAFALA